MEPIEKFGRMDRRHAVKTLLRDRDGICVVTGLGSPTYDVMALGDHDLNYYLWGAMGSAVMVGLGIAQSQPQRKVVVITGDGEMLMGMGSLATIAVQKPTNLSIVVLDNEHYGETGMQRSHTGRDIQLANIADVCGFDWTMQIKQEAEVETLRARIHQQQSLNFASIKIAANSHERTMPARDGVYIKNRFRMALGFKPN